MSASVFTQREEGAAEGRDVEGIASLDNAAVEAVYGGADTFDGDLALVAECRELVVQFLVRSECGVIWEHVIGRASIAATVDGVGDAGGNMAITLFKCGCGEITELGSEETSGRASR